MVAVTLENDMPNSIPLDKILDYVVTKNTPIPKKTVRDRTPPTTEAEHYTDYPREILIECRLTSGQKATLYDMENDKLAMYIKEDGVIVYTCWLEDVDIKYEITEHIGYPWRTTLKFVVITIDVPYIPPPAYAYFGLIGDIYFIETGGYYVHYGTIAFYVEETASLGVQGGCYFDR